LREVVLAAVIGTSGLERAEDYRWSSVRCWLKRGLPDEPLRMDLDRIRWRRAAGRA